MAQRRKTNVSVDLALFIVGSILTAIAGAHLIMPPLEDKTTEEHSALLLLPETGTNTSDYQMLGILIQNACRERLWVAVLDLTSAPSWTLDNLPVLLYGAKRQLRRAGMPRGAAIFLGTHGQVGNVACRYAQAMPSELRGVLLFGYFLHEDFPLSTFPVRVMTLVGDLDGVTRITRIARTVQTMEDASHRDPEIITRFPLVVIEGGNHAVFNGGDLPWALQQLDIEPEVNSLEALQSVSHLVSLFLTSCMDDSAIEESKAPILHAFKHAQNITNPINSVRNITEENMKSYWVKSAQKWISGLQGAESTLIEVDSFVTAPTTVNPLPPTLGKEGGIHYVITFSDVLRAQRANDVTSPYGGTSQQSAREIAARMIGAERIQKHLLNTSIARNYTCRDVNYASYLTAYHLSSQAARDRFDKSGSGAHFEHDIVFSSQEDWASTPLKFSISGRRMKVTSASYKTGSDELPSQLAGLYFCKLLPPDRAMEWIYVDSLRRVNNS